MKPFTIDRQSDRNGLPVRIVCAKHLETAVPMPISDLIKELTALANELRRYRLDGFKDAEVLVMIEPRLQIVLTLVQAALVDDMLGAPTPAQMQDINEQRNRLAHAASSRIEAGVALARAQARRIAADPTMSDTEYRGVFPAGQAGADAANLMPSARGKARTLEVGGRKIEVGGVEGVPRTLRGDRELTIEGYLPLMIDSNRGRVDFFKVDPAAFALGARARDRLRASVPAERDDLAEALALAHFARCPVDVRLSEYVRTTADRGIEYRVVEVLNSSQIAGHGRRRLDQLSTAGG